MRKRTDISFPANENLPQSTEKAIQLLAEALSDPLDYRDDKELSKDLGIPSMQIRQLKHSAEFMEPVRLAFRRKLSSVEIDVIKDILVQSKGGSLGASRTFLELSGALSGKTTVILSGGSPSGQSDWVSQLSDEEMDREIHRLLLDTNPDDVVSDRGKVIPVDYDVLGEDDDVDTTRVGRDNNESEEGEASSVDGRETEEDGKE